ncbi:unnamed protein product [Menidia menidia]|uniref:(Atlantic silverside) hypothetical protein n=1 Tax=Menidia menidia TaxID=238744 RepID=A0A8S4B486_9TELE|nr:unnamed protein product [Menidia menidia]
MEVHSQESLGRWDGLGSRDASSRVQAMDNICQVVMRKAEAIGPVTAMSPSAMASGSPPKSDLNETLAHLLMLSKRCPFEDIRERCVQLLHEVQQEQEPERVPAEDFPDGSVFQTIWHIRLSVTAYREGSGSHKPLLCDGSAGVTKGQNRLSMQFDEYGHFVRTVTVPQLRTPAFPQSFTSDLSYFAQKFEAYAVEEPAQSLCVRP